VLWTTLSLIAKAVHYRDDARFNRAPRRCKAQPDTARIRSSTEVLACRKFRLRVQRRSVTGQQRN
jgi:hypothetical protein